MTDAKRTTQPRRIVYQEPWTPDRVMARLREAAATLRMTKGSPAPSGKSTFWPDFKQDEQTGYGYHAATARPAQATAEQIDRMDATLIWVTLYLARGACQAAGLADDAGMVVWARATGWSYERIARERKAAWGGGEQRGGGRSLTIPGGNARPSLVKIERDALLYLAASLNVGTVPVDREARQAKPPKAEAEKPKRAVGGIRVIAPERGPSQHDDIATMGKRST